MLATVVAALSVCLASSAYPVGAIASRAKHSTTEPPLYKLLPAKVKSSGAITDWMTNAFPPMNFLASTGKELTGVDVTLARDVAKLLGVKLEITQVTTFAELFPALATGRADMIWSAIFDGPTRYKTVTFADYEKTWTQIYTLKSEAKTYSSLKKLCGHTIAGETGTTLKPNATTGFKHEGICKGLPSLKWVTVDGIPQQNVELTEGRAQGVSLGIEGVLYQLKTSPGKYQMVGSGFYPTYLGVPFANNAFGRQLEHAVMLALDELIKNGTYIKTLTKFGLQDVAISKILIDKGKPQAHVG
jgi:polar amino acid transport system substrate-binding protein